MSKTIDIVLKTAKADSAFLYFILEANEGLCYFSTLDHITGQNYRLIKVSFTPEFEEQVRALIAHSQKTIQIEFQ